LSAHRRAFEERRLLAVERRANLVGPRAARVALEVLRRTRQPHALGTRHAISTIIGEVRALCDELARRRAGGCAEREEPYLGGGAPHGSPPSRQKSHSDGVDGASSATYDA